MSEAATHGPGRMKHAKVVHLAHCGEVAIGPRCCCLPYDAPAQGLCTPEGPSPYVFLPRKSLAKSHTLLDDLFSFFCLSKEWSGSHIPDPVFLHEYLCHVEPCFSRSDSASTN